MRVTVPKGFFVPFKTLSMPKENELPFLWKDDKGALSLSNDFLYDPKTDSWRWTTALPIESGAMPQKLSSQMIA